METRKILQDNAIRISATCVRVPVLRAHSLSINVTFEKKITLQKAYEELKKMPGLQLFENYTKNIFATPFHATNKEKVFCSRIRLDRSLPNTLDLWVVGDQLLKGASLNAVQIAELFMQKKMEGATQIPHAP